MKKITLLTGVLLLFCISILSQEVQVKHTIDKHSEKSEYKITSVFSGASNADFVKVRYRVPSSVNTIAPSSGGSISKKEDDGISFYAHSVDAAGIVKTLFYIQPNSNNEDITIEVTFVYAVGDDKTNAEIANLIIGSSNDYASYSEETPKDNAFVIKSVDTESTEVSSSNSYQGDYSIQLLSLKDYSDDRVMKYCLAHNLNNGDLIKRKVNGVSKISIGRYPTKEKANEAKMEMIGNDAKLEGAFVVSLK